MVEIVKQVILPELSSPKKVYPPFYLQDNMMLRIQLPGKVWSHGREKETFLSVV